MERPPKKYVCEKCGYLGDTSEHEGCDYLAWTTGEQLYIDHLERELALLKASPASASVAAPDYRIADRGFRWDAENRQHIPQLLIEFTPVPENAPNASSGWKDRDKLAAMLVAAPTPPVSEDRKDAELLDYIQNHGATIQIVPMANRTFGFEVGGLHKSRKLSVREAIDAAMQEGKP